MDQSNSLSDYQYFLTLYPRELNTTYATKLLFFEINLLNYRTRLYSDINFHIVEYLLPLSQINTIIEPLYLHKPTMFFHVIYTENIRLIKMFLSYNPTHYINNNYPAYSLLSALKTKHLPTIKALIPYTDINFNIKNITPYKYAISKFEKTHPIHILFEYLQLHKHSLTLLIHSSNLPIDTIKHIQTYFI